MNLPLIKYAVLCSGIFIAGWTVNGWRLNSKIDALKAEHATAQAKAAEEHASAVESLRAREKQNLKRLQDAQTLREQELKKQAIVADSLRLERDGLRDTINDYAQASGAASDSLTSCRDRASTLGNLLSESLRVQEELATDAEREAGNARLLLEAWPR
jgi:hypothetical protein